MSLLRYTSEPFVYANGGVASNVPVYVYHRSTTVRAPIFYDVAGTPRMNPLQTNDLGRADFWVAPGDYDLEAHGVRFPVLVAPSAPATDGSNDGTVGLQGPPGPKGDKGDSVTAGAGPPSSIIPGISTFIDAVSGAVYVYEED